MLSDDDLEKYARQIMVAGVGEAGQEKILATKITMVGVGAIACHLLPLLVGAGVGKIILIDDDVVDRTNLHRQLLFRAGDVGDKKIMVAKNFLEKINDVEIICHDRKILADSDKEYLAGAMIFDGSDNLDCKKLTDQLAGELGIPIIIGGVAGRSGQVGYFAGHRSKGSKGGKGYGEIFGDEAVAGIANCQTVGVLNSGLAMVAGLMADLFFDDIFLGKRGNRFFLVEGTRVMKLDID